jgi:hypothetical protein
MNIPNNASQDDPLVPLHLLIFALETAITTATCIADFMTWSEFSNAEKVELGKLYGPYMLLCEFLSLTYRNLVLIMTGVTCGLLTFCV